MGDIEDIVKPLTPWYRGYVGRIVRSADRFECFGSVEHVSGGSGRWAEGHISVRELPLGMWTEDFKERITQHIKDQKLREYKDESEDPSKINFKLFGDNLEDYMRTEVVKWKTYLDVKNMNLFDAKQTIKHYTDAREILLDFYYERFALYVKRRDLIIQRLSNELQVLTRERDLLHRVIQLDGEGGEKVVVQLLGKSSAVVFSRLEELGFTRSEIERMMKKPIGDFTLEKVRDLEQTLVKKKRLLDEITASTPYSLWREDLQALKQALEKDPKFDQIPASSSKSSLGTGMVNSCSVASSSATGSRVKREKTTTDVIQASPPRQQTKPAIKRKTTAKTTAKKPKTTAKKRSSATQATVKK